MRDGDALGYLVDRRQDTGREKAALAILALLPGLGLGLLRVEWLPNYLLTALTGSFVLLPLSVGGRLGALALAWKRGGSLEEMRSVGFEGRDLLLALLGRALSRGLAASSGARRRPDPTGSTSRSSSPS